MTNIKLIIANYQKQMAAAGLLRQAGPAQLSPQVAALRPSLTKVNRALTENPDLLRQGVQTSPFQILFEYTLPKLEPILNELGPDFTDHLIKRLYNYGCKLIQEQGREAAGKMLEEYFTDLPKFLDLIPIRAELDFDRIMDNYEVLHIKAEIP